MKRQVAEGLKSVPITLSGVNVPAGCAHLVVPKDRLSSREPIEFFWMANLKKIIGSDVLLIQQKVLKFVGFSFVGIMVLQPVLQLTDSEAEGTPSGKGKPPSAKAMPKRASSQAKAKAKSKEKTDKPAGSESKKRPAAALKEDVSQKVLKRPCANITEAQESEEPTEPPKKRPSAAMPDDDTTQPGRPFWYKHPRCTWGVMVGKKQIFSVSWLKLG